MIFTTAILSILACIATVTMEAAMSNDRSIIGTIVEVIEWCGFSLMLLRRPLQRLAGDMAVLGKGEIFIGSPN